MLSKALKTLSLSFESTAREAMSTSVALGLVAAAMMIFINMDKMSDSMKVLVGTLAILTSALFAGATAWLAYHGAMSWGSAIPIIISSIVLGAAGIASVAKGVKAFANGGFPDEGSMFIANEKGPELVGHIGGRTAVANNDMIVQAIENASYQGMVRAMSTTSSSNNVNLKIDANSNDLSRALAKSMAIEFRRQGYKI
jgi:hypothetical protein